MEEVTSSSVATVRMHDTSPVETKFGQPSKGYFATQVESAVRVALGSGFANAHFPNRNLSPGCVALVNWPVRADSGVSLMPLQI